jgi:hypothetical protein
MLMALHTASTSMTETDIWEWEQRTKLAPKMHEPVEKGFHSIIILLKCLELLQRGIVDSVDNQVVPLLKVRPNLLGTLRLQVGDVSLDTVNQEEHGTGVIGVPLPAGIHSTLVVLESLISNINDLLSSIRLLGRRNRGRRTGILSGDVPPETTGSEGDPR